MTNNQRVAFMAIATKAKGIQQLGRVIHDLLPGTPAPDLTIIADYTRAIHAKRFDLIDLLMERLSCGSFNDPINRLYLRNVLYNLVNNDEHHRAARLISQYGVTVIYQTWQSMIRTYNLPLLRLAHSCQGNKYLSFSHLYEIMARMDKADNYHKPREDVVRFLIEECGLVPESKLYPWAYASVKFFRWICEYGVRVDESHLCAAIVRVDLDLVKFLVEDKGIRSTRDCNFVASSAVTRNVAKELGKQDEQKMETLIRYLMDHNIGTVIDYCSLLLYTDNYDLIPRLMSSMEIPTDTGIFHLLGHHARADHRMVEFMVQQGHVFKWGDLASKSRLYPANSDVVRAFVRALLSQEKGEPPQKLIEKILDRFAEPGDNDNYDNYHLTCIRIMVEEGKGKIKLALRHRNRLLKRHNTSKGAELLHELGIIDPGKNFVLHKNLHTFPLTWHYLLHHGAQVPRLTEEDVIGHPEYVYCSYVRDGCCSDIVASIRRFMAKGTHFPTQFFTRAFEDRGRSVTPEFVDLAFEHGWQLTDMTEEMVHSFLKCGKRESVIHFCKRCGGAIPGSVMIPISECRSRFMHMYNDAYADINDLHWPVKRCHMWSHVRWTEDTPVFKILARHGGAQFVDVDMIDDAVHSDLFGAVKFLHTTYGLAPSSLHIGWYTSAAMFEYLLEITGLKPDRHDLATLCMDSGARSGSLMEAVLRVVPGALNDHSMVQLMYKCAAKQDTVSLLKYLHLHSTCKLDAETIDHMFLTLSTRPVINCRSIWQYLICQMGLRPSSPCMAVAVLTNSGYLSRADPSEKWDKFQLLTEAMPELLSDVHFIDIALQCSASGSGEKMFMIGLRPSSTQVWDAIVDQRMTNGSVNEMTSALLAFQDAPPPSENIIYMQDNKLRPFYEQRIQDIFEILLRHFGSRLPMSDEFVQHLITHAEVRLLRLIHVLGGKEWRPEEKEAMKKAKWDLYPYKYDYIGVTD